MKKIYVAHSKDFDYKNELYKPIRNSTLNKEFMIILPHEKSDELFNSKECIRKVCDAIIVEASYPKIGVGIEVGWADAYAVQIIAIYKKGFKLSESIKSVSKIVIEYESAEDMISKLGDALKKI